MEEKLKNIENRLKLKGINNGSLKKEIGMLDEMATNYQNSMTEEELNALCVSKEPYEKERLKYETENPSPINETADFLQTLNVFKLEFNTFCNELKDNSQIASSNYINYLAERLNTLAMNEDVFFSA